MPAVTVSLGVRGADELQALHLRLKDAPKELRGELARSLNRATKPIRREIRESARDNLPRRGGLAARVAKSKMSARRRMTSTSAGVRIVASHGYDIRAMDRGRLRKPLFGNKKRWYGQRITPGWFSGPARRAESTARQATVDAIRAVAAKVEQAEAARAYRAAKGGSA